MRKLMILSLLAYLTMAMPHTIQAQDDEDEEFGPITAPLWLATDEAVDSDVPRYVAFLTTDDGETLIEVGFGADVIFTATDEDGIYTGATLLPIDYEFASTLEIIDEETIFVQSQIASGAYESETNVTYTLTEREAMIWLENPREVIEYSMFGDCLGVVSTAPPGAYATADPILPLTIDEENGELWLGRDILNGSGTYTLETEDQFSQFPRVTTQTAIVGEDSIEYSYHSIAGGRDDCEMIYESSYAPFDGDYEAFFTTLDEMAEEETESE